MWQAVPTALILLGLVAASVLWHMEIFVVLAALALCIGVWEAAGAFLVKNIRIPYLFLICVTLGMVAATWFAGYGVAAMIFALAIVAIVLWYVLSAQKKANYKNISASVLVLAWIALLGSCAVALATFDQPAWMIALLILLPVANDTGGWLAGVLFGKHPMMPKISPKKSWEGLAGSLILSIIVAVVVLTFALKQPWWVGIIYGILAVIASTGGDLFESYLKRRLGIKDMGTLFPGHGGMLDRIDSILMWAPVCYILSLIFLNN